MMLMLKHARHSLALITMALCLTLAPVSAFAQDDDDGFEVSFGNVYFVITSVTAGAVTVAGALVVMLSYGGIATTSSTTPSADPPAAQRERVAALLDAYMSEHPEALRDALALGAGPAVTDLAHALHVPAEQHNMFATLLRERRGAMGALLEQPAGLERGYQALAVLSAAP